MNLNLHNKVFIVTGGASGIGEAICKLIANEGGIVVIADKNKEKSDKLAIEINEQKQTAFSIAVELTKEESCSQLINTVINQYNRIDGLVNNAGTNDKIGLQTGSVKAFEQSLRINLVQYFAMAHYALPHLIKNGGSIVNIGSKVSVTGQGNTSGYAAGKGGVNALTREWAVELLPHQIRVNAVLPAEVDTPQYAAWIEAQKDAKETLRHITSHIPFNNRFTKPAEIANTVAFLLSDCSSHTTGQILFVDGGYTHLDRMIT
ncbi:MAG: SDR family oxidoreductase [Bacteroidota bacterium]|nr:SDR family oxidoreductase [Bacteroidota bacterium]